MKNCVLFGSGDGFRSVTAEVARFVVHHPEEPAYQFTSRIKVVRVSGSRDNTHSLNRAPADELVLVVQEGDEWAKRGATVGTPAPKSVQVTLKEQLPQLGGVPATVVAIHLSEAVVTGTGPAFFP